MGQALYRKYRSRKLSEVVGQEHITKTLAQALKQGRISHAYLLTGPRGVGKTSIARILAHEINGLPYKDDSTHIDIIEIDAASNRRIDEIRELREKVHIAPASAKYKVYIIDEVHMLTREAFNALLKTLEEPPAHVIFILATTDAHKLPETIVSRTQRFSFKPIGREAVAGHLAAIAKQEGIKVSPDALELLADHGEGSFRDSISLLDQASSHQRQIGADDVRSLLGIPSTEAIERLLRSISEGADSASLMRQITSLYDQGYQAASIARQLSQTIRRQLVEGKLALDRSTALGLLDSLISVPMSYEPGRRLEIILLGATTSQEPDKQPAKPEQPRPEATAKPAPETKASAQEPSKPANDDTSGKPAPSKKPTGKLDESIWPAILDDLKKQHNTLYGVVRMAEPSFDTPGELQLKFKFAFHQRRVAEAANQKILKETIKRLSGKAVKLECSVDPSAPSEPAEPRPNPKTPEELATISNIFGGGELLES